MIRYQVRSKKLIDIVHEIKAKRLIMSPYFERNFIWRDIHRVAFIKTILTNRPSLLIYTAKGTIDIETMTTTSCIVQGQQRMATIVDYVTSKLKVDGKYFEDLESDARDEFLKYQIPIIDLDMNYEAPEINEIFQNYGEG